MPGIDDAGSIEEPEHVVVSCVPRSVLNEAVHAHGAVLSWLVGALVRRGPSVGDDGTSIGVCGGSGQRRLDGVDGGVPPLPARAPGRVGIVKAGCRSAGAAAEAFDRIVAQIVGRSMRQERDERYGRPGAGMTMDARRWRRQHGSKLRRDPRQ